MIRCVLTILSSLARSPHHARRCRSPTSTSLLFALSLIFRNGSHPDVCTHPPHTLAAVQDVIGTLQSAPEIESYTGQALSYSMVLGGAVYSSNGTLESAGALLFSVALLNNASISEVQDRSPAEACFWELEYGRAMMKRTFGDLTTFPFSKCYERSVLQGSLDDDIYLMILDYALMLCFASFVMSTGSWLTSKASLALPAVGFVLLAMVAACGLGSAIGIQYSAVVSSGPPHASAWVGGS